MTTQDALEVANYDVFDLARVALTAAKRYQVQSVEVLRKKVIDTYPNAADKHIDEAFRLIARSIR
ncbi:hypothetical protein LC612_30900 [Nostoc sp. CHAB 5834]|nr:hypothetical protein [Nostoc sp. CHAB 5834]